MKEFLAALAGGLFALLGSFLASRWQAKHQRANLLHEALMALYVDLIAECHHRRTWLDKLTEEYGAVRGQLGPDSYKPAVPVDARVDLLAPPRTKAAFEALGKALAALRWELEEDHFPKGDWDSVSPNMREWVEAGRAVDALDAAIRADLVDERAVSRRRGWWQSIRRAGRRR